MEGGYEVPAGGGLHQGIVAALDDFRGTHLSGGVDNKFDGFIVRRG